jgi:hypothetical protein
VRDSTSDAAEIRWEILKSMLDNFPQLLDRTEKYILDKKSVVQTNSVDRVDLNAEELMQKALHEYHKEHRRK